MLPCRAFVETRERRLLFEKKSQRSGIFGCLNGVSTIRATRRTCVPLARSVYVIRPYRGKRCAAACHFGTRVRSGKGGGGESGEAKNQRHSPLVSCVFPLPFSSCARGFRALSLVFFFFFFFFFFYANGFVPDSMA